MGNKIPSIQLNRHADKRLELMHPWVYSNEIHESVDLKRLEAGALVDVLNRHGDYVGTGFVNPHSLIAVRFLSRRRGEDVDEGFFAERFKRALQLREPFYGAKTPSRGTYRAVFGESDELPGLIVDRYGDTWVVEFHALGMEKRREELLAAFASVVGEAWKNVVVRTDVRVAEREGMSLKQELVQGSLTGGVFAYEDDIAFPVDPLHGQKTGFFFDQRENRSSFARLVGRLESPVVMDVYCHLGAWGLRALKAGAARVSFVDRSPEALGHIQEVAKKMGLRDRCSFSEGDALEIMKSQTKESVDAIALDPPAFITSKKNVAQGVRAYFANNREAVRLLKRPGYLSSSSCSFHAEEQGFYEVVAGACLDAGRTPQVVERGGPAWDHPSLAQVAETKYLKNILVRTL